jgi:hypothetical protein
MSATRYNLSELVERICGWIFVNKIPVIYAVSEEESE